MRMAVAELKSISPYSQSRAISSERGERETHDEYEKRVWRERIHADEHGACFIPPTAFKNMLAEAAKFTPRIGPSGGKSTWTKNFEAGIMVIDPVPLGLHRDAIQEERLFVPSDGKRGGGKRVWKSFPLIPSWQGAVNFIVYDDSINKEIFELYLKEGGVFIGIGRFRPRNNGFYGRFRVESVDWQDA